MSNFLVQLGFLASSAPYVLDIFYLEVPYTLKPVFEKA